MSAYNRETVLVLRLLHFTLMAVLPRYDYHDGVVTDLHFYRLQKEQLNG